MKLVRSDFSCPICGSSRWGTSGCTGPKAKQRGHCNGYGSVGCGFSWSRSREDWKVFVFVFKPASREDFRKAEARRLRMENGHILKMQARARAAHTKGAANGR